MEKAAQCNSDYDSKSNFNFINSRFSEARSDMNRISGTLRKILENYETQIRPGYSGMLFFLLLSLVAAPERK